MAIGDCADDQDLRAAWSVFCQQLQAAGDLTFKDHNPANAIQRADAFRFLTQNLGQAFDLALETRDTKYPVLHAFCTPSRKLGGDAADLTYQQAWIDGEQVYKVSGQIGSARFLNFTLQGQRPETQPNTGWPSLHEPFGDIPEVNLFGRDLHLNDDGSFVLFIGGERQGPNWLPTTSATRKLFIRQGFDSWDETPTTLSIERLNMDTPRPLPTPQRMIESMQWAGDFLSGMMRDWPDHPYQYSGGIVDPGCINQFPPDHSANTLDDKKRGRLAAHMCWVLADDEALIVEFDNHDGFWMVSLGGAFMNSMDFLYRSVSYTPARTKVDSDNKVRLILSSTDPSYHNWLDTQGFAAGNLTYRNLLSQATTTFATKLVKKSELASVLPWESCVASSTQRTGELLARFRGVQQRYFG